MAVTGLTAGFLASRLYTDPENEIDLTPARILQEPALAFPVEHRMGPVMVTVDYQIEPRGLRSLPPSCAKAGPTACRRAPCHRGLFHDTTRPDYYIEYFLDDSWADDLRRFDRFTAADAELRERRYAFHIGDSPPIVSRYIAEPVGR